MCIYIYILTDIYIYIYVLNIWYTDKIHISSLFYLSKHHSVISFCCYLLLTEKQTWRNNSGLVGVHHRECFDLPLCRCAEKICVREGQVVWCLNRESKSLLVFFLADAPFPILALPPNLLSQHLLGRADWLAWSLRPLLLILLLTQLGGSAPHVSGAALSFSTPSHMRSVCGYIVLECRCHIEDLVFECGVDICGILIYPVVCCIHRYPIHCHLFPLEAD